MDEETEKRRSLLALYPMPVQYASMHKECAVEMFRLVKIRYDALKPSLDLAIDLLKWTDSSIAYVIARAGGNNYVHCFEHAIIPLSFNEQARGCLPYVEDEIKPRLKSLAYEAIHEIGSYLNEMWIQMFAIMRYVDRFNSKRETLLVTIHTDRTDDMAYRASHFCTKDLMDLQHSVAFQLLRDLRAMLQKTTVWEGILARECLSVEQMDDWEENMFQGQSFQEKSDGLARFLEQNLLKVSRVPRVIEEPFGEWEMVRSHLSDRRKVCRYFLSKSVLRKLSDVRSHVAIMLDPIVVAYGDWEPKEL